MNNNKKNNNNGWILCPSKSFPGKFYYFNMVSGEAVWSLNELEKKSLKKDSDIHKMSNAFNHYPEPNSPPVAVLNDDINNNFNTDASYKLRPNCNSVMEHWTPQSQMCNQVLFPKYRLSHPSTYIPHVMWTPVPLSTQMVTCDTSEERKKMSDQITQTQELKEGILVQTSGMSLSDRFLNYYNTYKKFNFNDPIKPSKDYNYNKLGHNYKCCNNDTKLITLQNMHRFSPFETDIQPVLKGSIMKNQLNKKTEIVSKALFYKDDNKASSFEWSTENKKNKLDSSLDCTGTQTLDPSDLRLLLAKKRNKFNFQDAFNKFKGDHRNNAYDHLQRTSKKCVTFDLSDCDSSGSIFKHTSNKQKDVPTTYSRNQNPISETVNIHILKNLKKARMRTNVWFIMADLNVLLKDFEYIENFVKQDTSCQLVIPYAVLTIIRELSTLPQDSSKTVVVSRKIIRRLVDAPRHIILLESVRDVSVSISKQILDCSAKLLERRFHVVLITTDIELFTNAKAINLDCYMLEQIDDNIEHSYIQNDSNEELLESRNDFYNGDNEGLFLKKPNEFQRLVVDNKPETVFNRRIQIQNLNIENVNNFKRVVRNDVCNETTSVDNNSAHISNQVKAKHESNNQRNINIENSVYMTSNQIVSNDYNKGLNKPMNESVKNIKVQINSKCSKENFKRSVNLKEFSNTEQSDNNEVKKNQHQPKCISVQDQITFDGTEDKNIISHQPNLNACSNTHVTVSKKDNTGSNLLKELVDNRLNEKLKRFHIKNKVIAERIVSRGDEWICFFTQIMENFMSYILCDEFVHPCMILEAAGCIAKMFKDNESVEAAAYGLCALYNLIIPNGKLERNVNPSYILNTIGCGVLLVEAVKAAIPFSPQLMETKYSLIHLLHCIEDPDTDPDPCEFKNTPTVSGFEVDEDITAPKSTYVKEPSEVLKYLKKHFPEWKTYDEKCLSQSDESNSIVQSPKIIRTTGRHLNLVKINNVNKLTVSENINRGSRITKPKQNNKKNEGVNDTALKSASIKANQKSTSNYKRETQSIELGDFDHNDHNNTFLNSTQFKNGPNIIRNVGIIECFENKLKPKSLDDSSRDNKEIDNTLNDNLKLLNISDVISETLTDVAYQTEVNNSDDTNDKIAPNVRTVTSDISNDDSGLGNENCHARTIIKSFLIELSSSFKVIYTFLKDSALEIKQKGVKEQNKKAIHDKTDKTYQFLLLIMDKLKRIIERELDDGTALKSLLIKAGVDVANDKRLLRYKQVITKCLEQACILKRGLKFLLFITGENHDSLSVISEPDQSYICHFNIFE